MAGLGIVDNSGDLNGLGINTLHEAKVGLSQDYNDAGNALVGAEINADGDGVGKLARPIDVSIDYRTRVAVDTIFFADNFSHTVVNTSKYRVVNTTATNALSGGRWVLNNGNSVTSGQGTQVSTYAKFGLSLSGTLYFDVVGQLAVAPQTNNVIEWGGMLCSAVAAPTDGAFFRLNGAGVLQGVINSAGNETVVSLISSAGIDYVLEPVHSYHFLVVTHNDRTEFWIDDILTGAISSPPAFGAPFLSMNVPLCARIYNSGVVTTAQRFEISNWSVTQGDVNGNRLWPTTQCIMGNSSINAPDGSTAGFTANYVNNTAPVTTAAVAMINTAAAYSTLGGQFAFVAMATSEVDCLLFSYLNPAMTSAIPGKNLIIRGIRIETVNLGAAVATTPTILQFGIQVGSTAVTGVTVDSATAGTRAGRRVPLGFQSFVVGAAIGDNPTPLDYNLDAPIVCEPGCYTQVLVKTILGTATASQVIRGICMINGYFE